MSRLIKKIYEHGNCVLDVTNLRLRNFLIQNNADENVAFINLSDDLLRLKYTNTTHYHRFKSDYKPTHDEIVSAFEIAREFSEDNGIPFDDINLYGNEASEFLLVDEGYLIKKEEYLYMMEEGLKSTILTKATFRYRSEAHIADFIYGIQSRYRIIAFGADEPVETIQIFLDVDKSDDYTNSTIEVENRDIHLSLNLSKDVITSHKKVILPKIIFKGERKKQSYNLTFQINPNGSYGMNYLDHNFLIDLSSLPPEIGRVKIEGNTFDSQNHNTLLRTIMTVPDSTKIHTNNLKTAFVFIKPEGCSFKAQEKIDMVLQREVDMSGATGRELRNFSKKVLEIAEEYRFPVS